MPKKVTVGDIAEKAGVSPATVSRVINHREKVNIETIKAVEDAMISLGKSPADANQFREKRNLIVLNVPDINNIFYQQIMNGADVSAKAHGYDLVVSQYSLERGGVDGYLSLLKSVNAVGTILLSSLSTETLSRIFDVTPLVQCCEYNREADFPKVSINNYSSAKLATEYLIASGRNKIVFMNGPLTYSYAVERQRGFLDAVNNAGISQKNGWTVQLPRVDFDMAYAAMCQILDSPILPNGVFAVSDIIAAAAIRAAHHYNLKVPGDIAVVGFDNVPFSAMTTPTITTVSQPTYQLGYSACEMLIDNIFNPTTSSKSILLNTEFIIRESTNMMSNFTNRG